MKIHSLCIAKNEADIIEQTLRSVALWSDFIYVYDNGSSDGTWEIVLTLSKELPQVVPYRQDGQPFHNGLRSEMFNHFRRRSQPGDWWCRLDADEIYIDNPLVFLPKIPSKYKTVWSSSFQYYLSDLDAVRYQQNPAAYADSVPVEQKCRYYINNWSEIRFFKDHPSIEWFPGERWPAAVVAAQAYPVRIWLKHYQYRSPKQIQQRLAIRKLARDQGCGSFLHEAQSNWQSSTLQAAIPIPSSDNPPVEADWQSRILPAQQLSYDAHDGRFTAREDLLPTLNPVQERLRARIKLLFRAFRRSFVVQKNAPLMPKT